jgi:hypothetical protein
VLWKKEVPVKKAYKSLALDALFLYFIKFIIKINFEKLDRLFDNVLKIVANGLTLNCSKCKNTYEYHCSKKLSDFLAFSGGNL